MYLTNSGKMCNIINIKVADNLYGCLKSQLKIKYNPQLFSKL